MRFISNPGSTERITRKASLVNGVITVVPDGKEDWSAYINSFKDSCDVAKLVQRATYQPELLQKGNVFYGDITEMPKTYAEMLQKVIDVESNFNKLPAEVKEKFGNNPTVWMNSINDDDFMEKMGFVVKPDEVKEVNTDESER